MFFDENLLLEKKWFEYKFLSPDQCTKLFVKIFNNAFLLYEQQHGARLYYNITSKMPNVITSWKHYKTFTKMRQRADYHFIKYTDYCTLMFRGHNELKFKSNMPNAFLNVNLNKYIVKKEAEIYKNQLKRADTEYFKADVRIPTHLSHILTYRKEYQKWLVWIVTKKYQNNYTQLKKVFTILVENRDLPVSILDKI